jgi:hypothetical protein
MKEIIIPPNETEQKSDESLEGNTMISLGTW